MVRSLTATVKSKVVWTFQETGAVADTKQAKDYEHETSLANGDSAEEAEEMFQAEYTVTSGSPNQDVDLATVTNIFGDAVDFDNVRAVQIVNKSTTAGDTLKVGPQGVANGWDVPFDGDNDGVILCGPKGKLVLDNPVDGYAVNSGSKVLRVSYDGTSGSITFDLVMFGTKP